MTPEQATQVQDAAGLVAAHLRSDQNAVEVLLGNYASPQGAGLVLEAFVYYIVPAVQIQAQLTQVPWATVLAGLPHQRVDLIPGVTPDWLAVKGIVTSVIDASIKAPENMELPPCLEAAYGLAVSATYALGNQDVHEALDWAAKLSAIAGQET